MNIKSLVLATVISTFGAVSASADAHVSFSNYLESSSVLELGLITMDEPAILEIYDYIGGQQGAMLGSVELNQGANSDVKVNVGVAPRQDVLAVIKTDGKVISVTHYHVNE
jgi:hypothetical protein